MDEYRDTPEIEQVEFVDEKELVLKKLEEKYNEDFAIVKLQTVDFAEKVFTSIAYPEENPTILFKTYMGLEGIRFSDNYVSKCVFKKITDVIGDNLDHLNGYFYLYVNPVVESTSLTNPKMTVEEYVAAFSRDLINVYFHYCPETLDAEALYNSLLDMFDGLGECGGMIHLSVMDDEGMKAVMSYAENTDKLYDDYQEIVKPYYKGNIRVVNGTPKVSLKDLVGMLENK